MQQTISINTEHVGPQPGLAQLHQFFCSRTKWRSGLQTYGHMLPGLVQQLAERTGLVHPSILDLGSADGELLAQLSDAGFTQLSGVEINAAAVMQMQQRHPQLFAQSRIYNLPVEDVLGLFGDAEFDILLSANMLGHLHPDSDWVFAELARVTGSGLLTIEDESSSSSWRYARNYRQVFEGCGMQQIHEQSCGSSPDRPPLVARMFSHRAGR